MTLRRSKLFGYELRKMIFRPEFVIILSVMLAAIIIFSSCQAVKISESTDEKFTIAKKFGVYIDKEFRDDYWEDRKKTEAFQNYQKVYQTFSDDYFTTLWSYREAKEKNNELKEQLFVSHTSLSPMQKKAIDEFDELLTEYEQTVYKKSTNETNPEWLTSEYAVRSAETYCRVIGCFLMLFTFALSFTEKQNDKASEIIKTTVKRNKTVLYSFLAETVVLAVSCVLFLAVPVVLLFECTDLKLFSPVPVSEVYRGIIAFELEAISLKKYIIILCFAYFVMMIGMAFLAYFLKSAIHDDDYPVAVMILILALCAAAWFLTKNKSFSEFLPLSCVLEPLLLAKKEKLYLIGHIMKDPVPFTLISCVLFAFNYKRKR